MLPSLWAVAARSKNLNLSDVDTDHDIRNVVACFDAILVAEC
jgi:hypothetical protein